MFEVINAEFGYVCLTVLQVSASDVDSGDFGKVTYSIQSVSGNQASKFSINPESGQIHVTQPVARGDSYVLMVEAVDKAEKAEQRWAGRSGAEWGRLGAG